jgi:acyl CoA:acetate/3-ketoacid CoA transferase
MVNKTVREHKAMINSQEANSNKLNTQLLDSSHINVNDVGKVIDSQAIQELMNYFYKVTNIGIGIVDLKGNILVATGWQDICTKFHRVILQLVGIALRATQFFQEMLKKENIFYTSVKTICGTCQRLLKLAVYI